MCMMTLFMASSIEFDWCTVVQPNQWEYIVHHEMITEMLFFCCKWVCTMQYMHQRVEGSVFHTTWSLHWFINAAQPVFNHLYMKLKNYWIHWQKFKCDSNELDTTINQITVIYQWESYTCGKIPMLCIFIVFVIR